MKFGKIFTVFGGLVWAFESVTSIFHIRADMKKPEEFGMVMKIVFVVACLSFIVFG